MPPICLTRKTRKSSGPLGTALVTATTPASSVANLYNAAVPVTGTISCTFDRAVTAGDIIFSLTDNLGNQVSVGSVNYNSSTHAATLTPSVSLAFSSTYTATVSGVTPSPVSWSFITDAKPIDVVLVSPAVSGTSADICKQWPSTGYSSVTAAMSDTSYVLTFSGTPTSTGGGPALSLGQYIKFAGDSSGQIYQLTGGSGTSWTTTPWSNGAAFSGSTWTMITGVVSAWIDQGTVLYSLSSSGAPPSTYSFGLSYSGGSVAGTSYYDIGTNAFTFIPSSPLEYNTVYTATLSGVSNSSGTPQVGSYSWSFTTINDSGVTPTVSSSILSLTIPGTPASLSTILGRLTIPDHSDGPRLWWTHSRLDTARTWWASNGFTPNGGNPMELAFAYLMTGTTSYANTAINILMGWTIADSELSSTGSSYYRWNYWGPIVYDWCYDVMTPLQRMIFMSRYNSWTNIVISKSFGGIGGPETDYYWGILRGELMWAIASYNENPMALTYLYHGVITRWNDLLYYFATYNPGGIFVDGSQYGRYDYGYPVIPWATLSLMGYDFLDQTNWYYESICAFVYQTSPAPLASNGKYVAFTFGDDEQSYGRAIATADLGNFMSMMACTWPEQPIGKYARQWMATVQPTMDSWIASVDNSSGATLPFSDLPVDYYAAGCMCLLTRNTWASTAMLCFMKLSPGYRHGDAASFQIHCGNSQLAVEHTGYGDTFDDGTNSEITSAHNGIQMAGFGNYYMAYDRTDLPPLTGLESSTDHSYIGVDITSAYRTPVGGRIWNPSVTSVVREFLFVKPLATLVVVDRLQSALPYVNTESANAVTFDGNNGAFQQVTLNANLAVGIANVTWDKPNMSMVFRQATSGGPYSISSWPDVTLTWQNNGGVAPTLSSTPGAYLSVLITASTSGPGYNGYVLGNGQSTQTFLLHTPGNPTLTDGTHATFTQGDYQLWLTTLPTTGSTAYAVYNEGVHQYWTSVYRLEDVVSGSQDTVFIHAITCAQTAGSNPVTATLTTQGSSTYMITLTSGSASAVMVIPQAVGSTGGTFGYASSGTPTQADLRNTVQSLTVDINGPSWGE